jgi:hypothetical protein
MDLRWEITLKVKYHDRRTNQTVHSGRMGKYRSRTSSQQHQERGRQYKTFLVVRAMDVPRPTSVQVRPEVKLKCEAPPSGGVSKLGCASADLYQRFHRSSLTKIRALPDWTVFSDLHGFVEEFVISSMMASLAPHEAEEWRVAAERAAEDGSFFLTWPHHCAVGTKPG